MEDAISFKMYERLQLVKRYSIIVDEADQNFNLAEHRYETENYRVIRFDPNSKTEESIYLVLLCLFISTVERSALRGYDKLLPCSWSGY